MEVEPKIEEEDALSLSELAYLLGQMAALREHPGTMPSFEETWVRVACVKRIRQEATFATLPEDRIEPLTEAYYRGYRERFDDYFDERAAWEFGYNYGLKFDPIIHRYAPLYAVQNLLESRACLEAEYGIPDEAEWRLFCEAFLRGYQVGYYATKEGVTVRTRGEAIAFPKD